MRADFPLLPRLVYPFVVITLLLYAIGAKAAEEQPAPGVVSHVKVLSDKVEDVSSLEAWKQSFIKPGMTDQQKALAVWETVVKFRNQDAPPNEYLGSENNVHDPIKSFNVYGYGMCCCASANIAALARYAGLEARGWGITNHSVPEVKIDGHWGMLDASLINYCLKPDGSIAGVEEISKNITEWYAQHPDYRDNSNKLMKFMQQYGWKQGPAVLAGSTFYDINGWLPAATHGWYSTMWEFGREKKNFPYEYGAAVGYEVNIQLRPGEKLVRNWSNKGLHVNMFDSEAPGSLNCTAGQNTMRYSPSFGDLGPGRIGNGTLEYDLPLASGAFRAGALAAENLAAKSEDGSGAAIHVKDAAKPSELIIRMPSSYVYLGGTLDFTPVVGNGGSVTVSFSDNNGLDWKKIDSATESGARKVDLKSMVFRRYDYRLKFALLGKGTGLDAVKLTHDIQHSQRILPALVQGDNHIHFTAGLQEGTITVQGAINSQAPGKNLAYSDFHPTLQSIDPTWVRPLKGAGQITFPVQTPGDISRVRVGAFYRARDAKYDGWTIEASFDMGNTWKPVGELQGPYAGNSKYFVFSNVAAGARSVQVRFTGRERNTTLLQDVRIDADYVEPHGGFAPIKVTYAWEEDGKPRQNVHVAANPDETYVIRCDSKPLMKSIVLELP